MGIPDDHRSRGRPVRTNGLRSCRPLLQETSDAEPELSDDEMDLLSDLVDASELEAAARGES